MNSRNQVTDAQSSRAGSVSGSRPRRSRLGARQRVINDGGPYIATLLIGEILVWAGQPLDGAAWYGFWYVVLINVIIRARSSVAGETAAPRRFEWRAAVLLSVVVADRLLVLSIPPFQRGRLDIPGIVGGATADRRYPPYAFRSARGRMAPSIGRETSALARTTIVAGPAASSGDRRGRRGVGGAGDRFSPGGTPRRMASRARSAGRGRRDRGCLRRTGVAVPSRRSTRRHAGVGCCGWEHPRLRPGGLRLAGRNSLDRIHQCRYPCRGHCRICDVRLRRSYPATRSLASGSGLCNRHGSAAALPERPRVTAPCQDFELRRHCVG